MLKLPLILPEIEACLLRDTKTGEYHLTKVGKDVWGPLFAEAGYDIRQMLDPERFLETIKAVLAWRQNQAFQEMILEQKNTDPRHPGRKMTEALISGTPEEFLEALAAEERQYEAQERRSAFRTV